MSTTTTQAVQHNIHEGAETRATQYISMWVAGNYDGGEATCREWEARVSAAAETIRDDIDAGDDAQETKSRETHALAGELQDWYQQERGQRSGGSPIEDMLGYMESCVDWDGIAQDAIAEELLRRHELGC